MRRTLDIIKISVAVVLLLASGYALNNAFEEEANKSIPHLIGYFIGASLFVFPSAWLLRSGFTKDKRGVTYLKYLLVSIVIVAASSTAHWWVGVSSNQYHQASGVRVPLRKCIVQNKEFITDFEERKQFCSCVADKLVSNNEVYEKYKKKIKRGDLSSVYQEIKNKESDIFENYPCYGGIQSAVWIPEIEESFSKGIRELLKSQSEGDTTNNDAYCNCLMREIKKFNVVDVLRSNFNRDSVADVCRAEIFGIEIEYE